jgi:hypothetical protein
MRPAIRTVTSQLQPFRQHHLHADYLSGPDVSERILQLRVVVGRSTGLPSTVVHGRVRVRANGYARGRVGTLPPKLGEKPAVLRYTEGAGCSGQEFEDRAALGLETWKGTTGR